MNYTQKIEDIIKKLKTRRSKNIIYAIIGITIVAWFGYRFYAVNAEHRFKVFNITRNNLDNGTPVSVLKMEEKKGVLYEPLTVKNNTAFVSGARVNIFKPGQKSGDCKITFVSKNIDLDTGMHVIRTSGCKDGMHYIEKEKVGFYVPVSAMNGNSVYVTDNDTAKAREIVVADRDAQNVLVKSGLSESDIVILSKVKDGEKIKIIED
jgi:hypothetical protein